MDGNTTRRFELTSTLGQGGFGTVYRAVTVGEGGFRKTVALKVLKRQFVDDPEIAARLRDEARILSMLRHRAVTAVEDLLLLNGSWTLVMEFVDGVSLGVAVQDGPMPVRPALEIAAEIASVLHVAYATPGPSGAPLHILHRDLKPANVILTAGGAVKVLDFGIARAEFEEREANTRSLGFGSPEYMSPERLAWENGPAADVYALGAVLVELLTAERFGRPQIVPERHTARIAAVCERIVTLHGEQGSVAAELIAQMLAFEVEERPTAREVERRVDAALTIAREPRLRDWAEEHVPRLQATLTAHPITGDEGTVVLEVSPSAASALPEPAPPGPSVGLIAALMAFAVLALGLALGGGYALYLLSEVREAELTAAERVAVAPGPITTPAVVPAPEPPVAPVEVTPAPPSPETPGPKPTSTRPAEPEKHAAPDGTGRVVLSGDATVQLTGYDGRAHVPGALPAGEYKIVVTFPGGDPIPSGTLSVAAGGVVKLRCDAMFKRCMVN